MLRLPDGAHVQLVCCCIMNWTGEIEKLFTSYMRVRHCARSGIRKGAKFPESCHDLLMFENALCFLISFESGNTEEGCFTIKNIHIFFIYTSGGKIISFSFYVAILLYSEGSDQQHLFPIFLMQLNFHAQS